MTRVSSRILQVWVQDLGDMGNRFLAVENSNKMNCPKQEAENEGIPDTIVKLLYSQLVTWTTIHWTLGLPDYNTHSETVLWLICTGKRDLITNKDLDEESRSSFHYSWPDVSADFFRQDFFLAAYSSQCRNGCEKSISLTKTGLQMQEVNFDGCPNFLLACWFYCSWYTLQWVP